MGLCDKIALPMHRVWSRLSRRLGMRKTGLVKLKHEVTSCDYEDVHVLWELLKKSDAELAASSGAGKKKSRLSTTLNSAAKRSSLLCRSF